MREVKVTYEGGHVVSTSMNPNLSDSEILDYFKIGRKFNIGSVNDLMCAVTKVEIIK